MSGAPLIILGVVLLIIGFIAKIAIVWTIGIVVLVVGAIHAVDPSARHSRQAGFGSTRRRAWPG